MVTNTILLMFVLGLGRKEWIALFYMLHPQDSKVYPSRYAGVFLFSNDSLWRGSGLRAKMVCGDLMLLTPVKSMLLTMQYGAFDDERYIFEPKWYGWRLLIQAIGLRRTPTTAAT